MGAGRRAAQAALRPDPEPRRDVKGYAVARARDVRGGHDARTRARSRRRARPSRARRRACSAQRSAGSSRSPRRTRSCRRDENFRQLQEELAQTENRIAVSRQVYNDTVLTYNTAIQTVPACSSPARSGSRRRTSSRSRTRRGRRHASRSSESPLAVARGARARRGRRREVVRPARGGRDVQVARDGSLLVDEVIVFQFDGSFTGAFREVPLRDGESLDQVAVSEGEAAYRPGACAELGCSGSPGRSARPGRTRACGSCGTTRRNRSRGASASTTGCAASRRPTTTWST